MARRDAADKRFWRIAGAGAAFQGGSAAVDSATVVASLVHMLTGSALAVGYASSVLRLGWLLPQLFVGYFADRTVRRMPFYAAGAYGRAVAAALIGSLLWWGADWPQVGWPPIPLAFGVLVLWTIYAFVSGIVAVPYNDIVGRAIPSRRRSRLFAWRFFGGGLLAVMVAVILRLALDMLRPLNAYALIFGLGAALMFLSATLFVSAGEPSVTRRTTGKHAANLPGFLREGLSTLRRDRRFRLFLIFQWLGAATLMALPFYVIAAAREGLGVADVGTLLAAQTVGALVSNPLWGRIGDRAGKLQLLQVVAFLRIGPPALVLLLVAADWGLTGFTVLYFLIGAMMNGITIGHLGFLMEISPDDRRPAYSAWFNSFAAPAALAPLLGGMVVSTISLGAVFTAAILAALGQLVIAARLSRD